VSGVKITKKICNDTHIDHEDLPYCRIHETGFVDADSSLAPLVFVRVYSVSSCTIYKRRKETWEDESNKELKKYDIYTRDKKTLYLHFFNCIWYFIIIREIPDPFLILMFWIRCLEEGADEFFLKPVRLSDMSKLKPHILKSRCKEQCHQEQQQQSDSNSNECSMPTSSSSDNSNGRKRKAEDNEEVLPQTNRSRHS